MTRSRALRDQTGLALPIVLMLGFAMVLLVGTSLGVVSSGLTVSVRAQQQTGALDAAYAGAQEYAARLDSDSTYPAFGDPTSPFSVATGSSVSLPTTTNPAFGRGAAGTWATVAGSGGTATFRYEVDNSRYGTTGIVNLRSTGRVGAVTRSVVAAIRQDGFINYLYFTDYEVQDPLISHNSSCAVYAWQTARSSSCTISFTTRDTITGPVHSNDTLSICGTTFGASVTSSNPNTPIAAAQDGCASTATYAVGGGVTYSPMLAMPSSNASMATTAASTGCLYTGPTQVTYNVNGTMTVVSPWSKKTAPGSAANTTPSRCGAIADLHSAAGATVPVLQNNLLYVQDVPGTSSDPNYAATDNSGLPLGLTCLDASGAVGSGSSSSAGWAFGALRYPLVNEAPATGWANGNAWDTTSPAYGCRAGNLFVSGTLSGVTSAASSNYVYVVGDLKDYSQSSDLLGLVGNSAVLVWNPIRASDGSPMLTDSGREIDAAILSVQHTFQVQNYNKGTSRGSLTVFGSIAQKYRGPVATTYYGTTTIATGYAKNYQYDARLASAVPPYFLAPTSSLFAIVRYAQVSAAYDSTGATP